MNKISIILIFLGGFFSAFSQKVLHTESPNLAYKVNENPIEKWEIFFENNPDVLPIECTKRNNKVHISDGKNMLTFSIKKGQNIDFQVITKDRKTTIRLMGVAPNVNFTPKYIRTHKGKTFVNIPQVSELVNILMVLHPHAERDDNMFDTESAYYQRVKAYFEPFRNHPAVDTIRKYITQPRLNREQMVYLFPQESYMYYYALKMNAVSYYFDKNGRIKNDQIIRQVGIDWATDFDPMKDVAVFEDFAKKSNFLTFYNQNKSYYEELLATYMRLNPIERMQNWLTKKFGFGFDSYMIFFSPLNKGAQAATSFRAKDFKQTFMFVCKVSDNQQFSPQMNELLASWIVFTEIDHNYVNPTSDKMLPAINEAFSDRKKWAVGQVADAYPDPYTVFNEYMTFGLMSLYAHDFYSAEDVNAFLPRLEQMMQNTRGFVRFSEFNRVLLEKYKENTQIPMKNLFEFMLDWAKKQ